MFKIKINHSKNFAPLTISKGTTEQRLQKARLLNLRFYDNLQDVIKNNEIAPKTFATVLKKTLGTNIGLDIFESTEPKEYKTGLSINDKSKTCGYYIFMPLHYYSHKIHKNNARKFLKETLSVFNDVLNPKFLTRAIVMNNKGYNVEKSMKFFQENISKTNELKEETLNTFLDKKSNDEKIETLQFLRYKLLAEKNIEKARYQIDKSYEKHNKLNFEMNPDYYSLDKCHYSEKLALLNQKLAEIIQTERSKY